MKACKDEGETFGRCCLSMDNCTKGNMSGYPAKGANTSTVENETLLRRQTTYGIAFETRAVCIANLTLYLHINEVMSNCWLCKILSVVTMLTDDNLYYEA